MNPNPCPGQRWIWNFNQRSINSSCLFEVTEVISGTVYFKYVQIIYTNYSECVGNEGNIPASYLNNTHMGEFIYLTGQDAPVGA